jgi:endonuclease/exonuclease/phosphatase (EEP) superfamily protein YafD
MQRNWPLSRFNGNPSSACTGLSINISGKIKDSAKFLFSIIFILFIGSCYTPTISPLVIKGIESPAAAAAGSDRSASGIAGPVIRILSWNIHKEGNDKKWINDILDTNCTLIPDIFLFQEAKMNAGLKYILQTKKLDWRFVPNAVKNDVYTGVLTASPALTLKDTMIISAGREPLAKTPKTILITSYPVKTEDTTITLMVANVHGLNFGAVEDFYRQIEQLYELLLPHAGKEAMIVAGDFNTWSTERKSFVDESLSKLDLKEVTTLQNVTTPSWFVRLITPAEKLPLDRVYYSYKKLTVDEFNSKVLECVHSSDHKPIYVEFRIQ